MVIVLLLLLSQVNGSDKHKTKFSVIVLFFPIMCPRR